MVIWSRVLTLMALAAQAAVGTDEAPMVTWRAA